uniref:FCP1 homology domain-containing protein n=2 Tax=Cafeteria roenbergensis TaxID=33653 RepID=A0A7S0JXP0_CAFRO|mmetsp:Transcript_19442/g.74562  ORF Transcript_19442/g.74562 Transcript_19442/m.74562 type:complete len:411 (+) Transcript_19442:233-1465(+)
MSGKSMAQRAEAAGDGGAGPHQVAVTTTSRGGPCAWVSGVFRACARVCPCACASEDPGTPQGGSAGFRSSADSGASPMGDTGGDAALAAASATKPNGAAQEGGDWSKPSRESKSTADGSAGLAMPSGANAGGQPRPDARGASVSAAGSSGATKPGRGDSAPARSSQPPELPPPPPPPPAPDSTLPGFLPIVVPRSHRRTACGRVPLLPPALPQHEGKMCLVLDLDETLVHSNFKAVAGADLVVPVRLGAAVHPVHVMARPGLVNFMEVVARHFEVVVFTASVDYYANPLLDRLDPSGTLITHRLFRESCVLWQGNYIKDMSLLGRDERRSIIVDNSPASYLLHPQNALPCTSFFDDKTDNELPRLGRFLRHLATRDVPDVRQCLIEWSVFPDHGLGEDDTDVEPMGTRAS